MSVDRGPVERPKKIIIVLSGYSGSGNESTTIPTDLNEYPQTVHLQRLPWIEKPSRIDRLVDRLGLKKDRKLPIDDAVAGSYKFISRNYRTGDHLILVVDVILPRDEKSLIDAAETLAKHLHNGTIPRHLPKTQSEDGSYALGRCIPLYSVIVDGASVSESISDWNDQIKSRFPPGIKYITCSRGDYSCSTMSNPDGGLDSREICFYQEGVWPQVFSYCTRKAIYYGLNQVFEWDHQDAIWTRELSTPPTGSTGQFSIDTRPVGMYRHELTKYRDPDRLVWRSFRQ